jgi:hypothetical protein
MTDVAFRASATNGATSGTAMTVSKPTGATTNDILIFLINVNDTKTVTDNNGSYTVTFASLGRRAYNSNSAGYYIGYRVVGASDPASYAFTLSGSDRWSIICLCYQYVDTSTIWDVEPTSTTENIDTYTPFATDAITTVANGAMIVAAAFGDTASATFNSTPGDSFNSRENNDGEQLIAAADKAMATAGAQSAVSWGSATASQEVATQIFSLKPTAAAAAEIYKINGIETGGLLKILGISKGSVAKVNGKTV